MDVGWVDNCRDENDRWSEWKLKVLCDKVILSVCFRMESSPTILPRFTASSSSKSEFLLLNKMKNNKGIQNSKFSL